MTVKNYILSSLLISISLFSFSHSAEIKLDVNLLRTGQYNVSDFLNPSVSLWTVTAQCIDCPEGGLAYRLEVKLNFNDIKPAIWGVTYERNLTMGSMDELTNFDFQGGAGLLQDYTENEDFIAQLEETYYLPAGNVELAVTAYEACPFSGSWRVDYNVDCNSITSDESLSNFLTFNNVVSELVLLGPINDGNVLDAFPWFRWESPGFNDGVQIDYKLNVYLFDSRFHSSYLDAIEDDNYLYFSTEITEEFETGTPRQIQVQYPSDDRELACGYQYVWFIEAKDIIQDSPFDGTSGIWGWPEPITSPIYTFNYGATIRSENIVSPSIGSSVNSVRPSFHIDPISCANSYEIWLSDSEDSEVENPIWSSEALGSNVNVYPFDATGLAPARHYKWKVRLNPDGEPSPWSNIFDFSISDYSLDIPASGEVLSSVTPTFYFTIPMDIAGIELCVSDSDDPLVESGNIFSANIASSGFQLPQDISVGLLPGRPYYWKIIFIDGNDNIVGNIDDYTKVESFRIKDVELNLPSNGTNNTSLSPSFIWDGITGIPQYELSISVSDDPTVENPFFVNNVSGTFFQYPHYADYPLEYGTLYYWRIIPLDANENRGASSEYFSFSTESNPDSSSDRDSDDDSEFEDDDESDFDEDDNDVDVDAGIDDDIDPEEDINEEVNSDEDNDDTEIEDDDNDVDEDVATDTDDDTVPEEEINEDVDTDEDTDTEVAEDPTLDDDAVPQEETDENVDTESNETEDEDINYDTSADVDSNISDMVMSSKPEFSISNGSEDSPKNIIINLLARVSGGEEYLVYFALDQEMEVYLAELSLVENQTELILDASDLDWSLTIYIQIFAMSDGELVGEPSMIQLINLPSKPGSNDQVGIWISLEAGSTQPTIEIINTVTNAYDYIMELATDSEMTEIFYYAPVFDNMPAVYPDFAPPLSFGQSYFIQVSATDDDGIHGIPSSVETIFIPNIIPPSLNEEFSWDASVPESNLYLIQVSTTDDFTSIIIEEFIDGFRYTLSDDSLDPGTIYYWRVQGYDSNSNPFGGKSNVRFFETEGEPIVIEETDGGQIVMLQLPSSGEEVSTIHPLFQWESIESAEKYEIRVSASEDYSEIMWQSANVAQNSVQYPSSGVELLLSQTIYYWSARAISENIALGEYSESFEFIISEDNTPILTGPMNSFSDGIHPFFTWNKISRASSYGLVLGGDEDCSQIILENNGISKKYFQYPIDAPPLDYNSAYYWKVISYDENGDALGDFSSIATFQTPDGIIEIEFIYEGWE